MSGQPEVLDNGARYRHDAALAWIAGRFPRPLAVATGYVRLDGLRVLAELPGPHDRPIRLLIGAAPDPGLGEAGLLDEVREASQFVDRALRRLREERDFDAFPPSRRLRTLAAVDAFLASPQVEVRRYTKRFLHGKVYLFADPPGQPGGEPGAVVVTSANLTGAGLSANLELGLAHYQPGVVREAATWFDELWAEAVDVKEELRRLLFPELPAYSPQAVFLRMLLERYGDELDTTAPTAASGLARFQEDGFRRARRIAERLGGIIYADGVGTGKTHVGLAFLRAYAVERGLHALIVAPAQLRDTTWEPARDRENLPGQVVSYQELALDLQLAPPGTAGARRVLNLPKDTYRLVIVDEAHAFRNPDTTYYRALDRLLGGTPKTLVLLTATPVNNALWDLYHLIMLFARHDAAFAEDLGIRDLRRFFRDAGANDPDLVTPARLFPLIDAVAVRRDRRFLEAHYAGDAFPDGTPVRFPAPQLLERRYDLDAAYPQAVRGLVAAIGELTMARYTPSRYLRSGKGEDAREAVLAGLIQSGLLKRLESSAYAARETARRILAAHDLLIDAWTQHGTVPSPAALRELVAEAGDGEAPPEAVEELLAADAGARPASDFTETFLTDVQADRERLERVVGRLDAMLASPDPKLAALRYILTTMPARKVAVFTGFADTARYLADALGADVAGRGGRDRVQHQRYELLRALAQDPNRHLILVTATPHAGVEESFRSLLGLLRPEFDVGGDEAAELDRRTLLPHAVQRRRSDLERWLGAATPFPARQSEERTYTLSPTYETLFDEALAYCRESLGAAGLGAQQRRVRHWAAIAVLRCVLSSPEAAVAVLANRARKEGLEEAEPAAEEEIDAAYRPQVLDPIEDEQTGDYVPPGHRPDARLVRRHAPQAGSGSVRTRRQRSRQRRRQSQTAFPHSGASRARSPVPLVDLPGLLPAPPPRSLPPSPASPGARARGAGAPP